MKIEFEVFGVPAPKGDLKIVHPKNRPFAMLADKGKRTQPWKQTVANTAMRYRPNEQWLGPVSLTLIFQLPKPKRLPKTRFSYHLTKPDADKLTRAVKDGLTGVLYRDDSQVVHEDIYKIYADVPSVIITASEVPECHISYFQERHLTPQFTDGGD